MKRSVARTVFKTEWVPGRVPLENCLCYSLGPKELPIQMAEEEGTMYSGNLVCSKLCKAAFSGSRCLLARSGAAGRSAKPALSLARSAARQADGKTLLAAPLLAPLRLKVLEGGLKLKWRGRPKRQARPVSCSIRGRPKRQADGKTLLAAPLLAPLRLKVLEGGLKLFDFIY